jgi:hypothetical protein
VSERNTIAVPDLGDFRDVEVIEVLVSPGDVVEPESPLVTLETDKATICLLYTSPSPRDRQKSRMPSSA